MNFGCYSFLKAIISYLSTFFLDPFRVDYHLHKMQLSDGVELSFADGCWTVDLVMGPDYFYEVYFLYTEDNCFNSFYYNINTTHNGVEYSVGYIENDTKSTEDGWYIGIEDFPMNFFYNFVLFMIKNTPEE